MNPHDDPVRAHYERHPYPDYPLWFRPRRADTYAWHLDAVLGALRGAPPDGPGRILVAGCGAFAPLPASLANPAAEVVALDLSGRALARARLRCALHLRGNARFIAGDLLDPAVAPGPFHLIDAYGVLHHLPDPRAGFAALAARLHPHGVMRIMVYHRDARRLEESARRAFRAAGVRTLEAAKRLLARARPDGALERLKARAYDLRSDAGIADALLHPRATTFTMRRLLDDLAACGLAPLLFAHPDALDDPAAEARRVAAEEAGDGFDDNLVVYAGFAGPPAAPASRMRLNPCLAGAVSPLRLLPVRIPPRIGRANPPLGFRERAFLRRFRGDGLPLERLPAGEAATARAFARLWFLIPA